MNAAEVRARVLAQRRALSSDQIGAQSGRIVARFLRQSAIPTEKWNALKIALYRALPSELSLLELEKQFIQSGARLFFPRILNPTENRQIEFVEIAPDQVLQEGPYGIQEPHPDLKAIDPAELDLIFVPGVAFGQKGERVGMGAGYYDRFLARIPNPLRVVLSFDFQLFDRLEQNPWDQPVDWIVTETREVRNSRVTQWLESLRK